MSNQLRVRHATSDDAAMLVGLINAAFVVERFFKADDRTTADEIHQLLDRGTVLVIEEPAGTAVGSVYVERCRDRVYIGMLSVDPNCQGRGIGRTLMREAEQYGRWNGCIVADITVVNLRTELMPFYRAQGYVETGTKPFPYPDATKDCHLVVMSKPLRNDR